MSDQVIIVENIYREYLIQAGLPWRKPKVVKAVNGISFDVRRGEIFGLLGPNGAGKTTTIKIISTLLAPSAGKAYVLGHDTFRHPERVRPHINLIMGGERNIYWRLTGRENLQYFADLYLVPRERQRTLIPELLETVGLRQWADERVETYSKGMKQRLQIARGLINDPDVLFMDEPSIGLDPVSAQEMRQLVLRLRDMNKTIILTTHYMFEADQLCDRIAIINQGKIVALDTPDNLKRYTKGLWVIEYRTTNAEQADPKRLRALTHAHTVSVRSIDQHYVVSIQTDRPGHIIRCLKADERLSGVKIDTHVREATLEDAYVKLIGEGA